MTDRHIKLSAFMRQLYRDTYSSLKANLSTESSSKRVAVTLSRVYHGIGTNLLTLYSILKYRGIYSKRIFEEVTGFELQQPHKNSTASSVLISVATKDSPAYQDYIKRGISFVINTENLSMFKGDSHINGEIYVKDMIPLDNVVYLSVPSSILATKVVDLDICMFDYGTIDSSDRTRFLLLLSKKLGIDLSQCESMINELKIIDNNYQLEVAKLRYDISRISDKTEAVRLFTEQRKDLISKTNNDRASVCKRCVSKTMLENIGLSDRTTVQQYIVKIQEMLGTHIKVISES